MNRDSQLIISRGYPPPADLGLAMDNSSESGVTGCRSGAAERREERKRGIRDQGREREGMLEKVAGGIARVNALSRCWSCLITSYQLKGKRRDAGARERVEERREKRNRIMASCEASDCGDSEFLVELHRPLPPLPSLPLSIHPLFSSHSSNPLHLLSPSRVAIPPNEGR